MVQAIRYFFRYFWGGPATVLQAAMTSVNRWLKDGV
jgi:hypothetical protein